MTQASLKRAYPRLVRMVERQAHSKFKRKPTLVIVPRGPPRCECTRVKKKGTRTVILRVDKARVLIPRRMARENPELAALAVCHEARDVLAFQNGNTQAQSHMIAQRAEKTFREKLGIQKSGGWKLREHYERKKVHACMHGYLGRRGLGYLPRQISCGKGGRRLRLRL